MSADLGTARAKVVLDVSQLAKGAAEGSRSFQQLEKSASGLGPALSAIATPFAAVGGAIAVGLGAAVSAFGDFEAQINALGAVTGATEAQMSSLSDLALQIGQDTAFGASEAAVSLTELAKAGVPIETILNGAGEAAVNLASATWVDLSTAANALANSLNIFQEEGLEAADAADILTAAANASSADLGDLQAGMRNLGPVAANLGVSFQDAAGAIAYFTKFGLKGADVGVSLARALDRAAAPTDEAREKMHQLGIEVFDLQHNFVGFPAMFANLKQSMGGMSDEARTAALAMIFGAEAADVMNIAIKQGAEGYNELTASISPAGQALAASEARMAGLNGAIEQLKGSLETAAIVFGAQLAPAIEQAAQMATGAVNAFAALPQTFQQIAAGALATVGGLSLLAAGLAKAISLAMSTVATFAKLGTAISNSARAMSLIGFALSPMGLAVAALAIALGTLAYNHQKAAAEAQHHADVLKSLADATQSFQKSVASLRMDGFTGAADAIEGFGEKVNDTVLYMFDLKKQFAESGDEIVNWNGHLIEADALAFDLGKNAEAIAGQFGPMNDALNTSGVDVVKLAKQFGVLNQMLFRGDITAEQYNLTVTDMVTHLDRYSASGSKAARVNDDIATSMAKLGTGIGKTKQELADLAAAQAQFLKDQTKTEPIQSPALLERKKAYEAAQQAAEEALQAEEAFQQSVEDTSKAAIESVSGFEDLVPTLDGIQGGWNKVGTSAERALLHMDKMGAIDLTPAQRQALKLAENLDQVDAALARTDEAIAQNADDTSMWAGRISLVDETIGTAEDGYKALNDEVAKGNIPKEEANEIEKAGIWLRERAVGGMEDERIEQMRQLPILEEYVKAHDEAAGAVGDLGKSQLGLVTAMNTTEGQMALQQVQLLTYLASLGAIPKEKVTEVLIEMGKADPVIKAMLEDLGLIPDEKDVAIVAHAQTSELRDVKNEIDQIPDQKNIKVDFDFSSVGDGTELFGAAESDLTIPTKLGAPDTTAVDNAAADPVTIPTVFDAPDTTAIDATPETVHIPTILNAPMDDLVVGYQAETEHIPTILDAPDETAVSYSGEAVIIPTVYGAPGFTEGAPMRGPADVHIATIFDAPDDSAISYTGAAVIIPTVFGTPGFTAGSTMRAPADVHIATVYDAPDAAAVAYTGDSISIPTHYTQPSWGENTKITLPTVNIPTKYLAPNTENVDNLALDIEALITADTSGFDTALTTAGQLGDAFQNETFEPALNADASGFASVLSNAQANGDTFDGTTYTAILTADSSGAIAAISAAASAAAGFARTYTAQLTVNTTQVTTAVTKAAELLPSSPAKRGPLSKKPDFTYVVDAFVLAMDQISDLGTQSALDLGPALSMGLKSAAVGSLASTGTLGASSLGAGTTIVNARQFFALNSDEYSRMLAGAEMGAGAHDWILRRETAFATVGG